jgi:hypothetical protein
MSSEGSDPTVLRALAVAGPDLVSAVETNRTTGRTAVLRVTPPFSGRMRARLHVEGGERYESEPRPLHVPPARFLEDPPAPPRPADTEDELRADPATEYTVDRHRERHERALSEWRSALLETVRERTTVDTPAGEVSVRVSLLGDSPDTA